MFGEGETGREERGSAGGGGDLLAEDFQILAIFGGQVQAALIDTR